MDNGAEEDRERDGSTSSSTTWRTCSSTWTMPRIELNGEGEPVWLTPHLRDPQPEGERENINQLRCVSSFFSFCVVCVRARDLGANISKTLEDKDSLPMGHQ